MFLFQLFDNFRPEDKKYPNDVVLSKQDRHGSCLETHEIHYNVDSIAIRFQIVAYRSTFPTRSNVTPLFTRLEMPLVCQTFGWRFSTCEIVHEQHEKQRSGICIVQEGKEDIDRQEREGQGVELCPMFFTNEILHQRKDACCYCCERECLHNLHLVVVEDWKSTKRFQWQKQY